MRRLTSECRSRGKGGLGEALAERVFQEVRRWVEGRVYGSIEEKVEAMNAYLRRLESDPRRVRSLWIDDAVQNLPSGYAASSE